MAQLLSRVLYRQVVGCLYACMAVRALRHLILPHPHLSNDASRLLLPFPDRHYHQQHNRHRRDHLPADTKYGVYLTAGLLHPITASDNLH